MTRSIEGYVKMIAVWNSIVGIWCFDRQCQSALSLGRTDSVRTICITKLKGSSIRSFYYIIVLGILSF